MIFAPSAPPSVEDDLLFLDEAGPGAGPLRRSNTPWRLMIVDDDEDVHAATVFALGNLDIQHRPLEFLHAYSAAEAREMLQRESGIAVILLDVVMESEDAGLQLVSYVRKTVGMTETRIILRTGQPGYAPEIEAIRDFDINDYKTKSELTRNKLYTAVTAAIRSYEQIRAISASRRGLGLIVRASTELMAQHGLMDFAAGVITQISGLLGLEPEGLVCVLEGKTRDPSDLFVVAAAGEYRDFINRPITDVGDPRLLAALAKAMGERRHLYAVDHTVLYFAGSSGRDHAVFLNTVAPLSAIDHSLLEVFCSNITVGLDNVSLVSRLHRFAFHDALTELPNRRRFADLTSQMLTTPVFDEPTLALVDIDYFSEMNAALGHQFGDALLLAVAKRLTSVCGEQLTVARVGGDSFGLLGRERQVNPVSIAEYFAAPFSIDGQQVQVSATSGLVRLKDYEGGGVHAIKDAEIALKRAKLQQRSGYFYFSRSMVRDISERLRTMHALRSAFERHELFVVYQPQVETDTGRPVGLEALLRWRTDDGSYITPDSFIPIAEYSGLIIELGQMVLREACRELVKLRAIGFDLTMSVNVSQVQFRHAGFFHTLQQVLLEVPAPPHAIELEITESMAMQEPEMFGSLLEQVKSLGVAIAIDDFGTGFSSLSYLQQLKVDRLKIDRAFVAEITRSSRGSSIAEMVIQLGRNLGLTVIAEGVEDEAQAAALAALGCPQAQGYLYAKPMAPDQLAAWLGERRGEGPQS